MSILFFIFSLVTVVSVCSWRRQLFCRNSCDGPYPVLILLVSFLLLLFCCCCFVVVVVLFCCFLYWWGGGVAGGGLGGREMEAACMLYICTHLRYSVPAIFSEKHLSVFVFLTDRTEFVSKHMKGSKERSFIVTQTHKRSFIVTQTHNLQIWGVIPFVKLENNS